MSLFRVRKYSGILLRNYKKKKNQNGRVLCLLVETKCHAKVASHLSFEQTWQLAHWYTKNYPSRTFHFCSFFFFFKRNSVIVTKVVPLPMLWEVCTARKEPELRCFLRFHINRTSLMAQQQRIWLRSSDKQVPTLPTLATRIHHDWPALFGVELPWPHFEAVLKMNLASELNSIWPPDMGQDRGRQKRTDGGGGESTCWGPRVTEATLFWHGITCFSKVCLGSFDLKGYTRTVVPGGDKSHLLKSRGPRQCQRVPAPLHWGTLEGKTGPQQDGAQILPASFLKELWSFAAQTGRIQWLQTLKKETRF